MRSGNIFIYLLVLSGNIFCQPCISYLKLEGVKNGNVIVFDDSVYLSANNPLKLTSGRHFVGIKNSLREWTFINSEIIPVDSCGVMHTRKYEKPDISFFNTVPSDAVVSRGDSILGRTPMYLQGNLYDIIVTKTGYQILKLENNFGAGENPLKLLPAVFENGQDQFLNSRMFKILSGSLVILGGISAYTKIKADNYFDRYQAFGVDSDLRQTRKYDLISGISFGLMQINLAYLVYNFLIAENLN